MASLGIIVPAYRPNTTTLKQYVTTIAETIEPTTIRIELDRPRAETIKTLTDLPATINIVDKRRGKGAAVGEGFDSLQTDVLAFADADGATPATQLAKVTNPVRQGRTDVAVGSRRHPDATIQTNQTLHRRLLGDTFAQLAKRVLPVSVYDFQCGAKAITATGWQEIQEYISAPGFAWDIEFLAYAAANDLAITEIPIEWFDQPNSTVPLFRTAIELSSCLVRTGVKLRTVQYSRRVPFSGCDLIDDKDAGNYQHD